MLTVVNHPSLALAAFEASFPRPISDLPSPNWLTDFLSGDGDAPVHRDEAVRGAVRDLLRHGGFKPTGRNKPASEYLVKASAEGRLGTINLPVDLCNAVSLHSGVPISVVDLDKCSSPLEIAIVEGARSYVFNPAGQELKLEGLLCLFDGEGPCANAVKDSQRTKTHDGTRRTLSIMWGPTSHRALVAAALDWYTALHERAAAEVEVLVAP